MVAQHTNWVSELSFLDKTAVEHSIAKGYGYIDRKYIYRSVGINSTIAVITTVTTISPLWLCEVQKGFAKYPTTMTDLSEGVKVYAQLHYSGSAQVKNPLHSDSLANATSVLKSYEVPDFAQMKRLGQYSTNVLYYIYYY